MKRKPGYLVLGIDLSTQSISSVLLDVDTADVIHTHSIPFCKDPRLSGYGIDPDTMVLPSQSPGLAEQPPLLFIHALECLLMDLHTVGQPLGEVRVISCSAQQHGHVYLNASFPAVLLSLNAAMPGNAGLARHFSQVFTWPTAPIWKTSNTRMEADLIRERVGGREAMIRLSGSDSPQRFTGAVIRRVASQSPEDWSRTWRVKLLSSFLASVLTGNPEVPADIGNASGMSLMDYHGRAWSEQLVQAVGHDLPGGVPGLKSRLEEITEPRTVVGTVSKWFCDTFGFSRSCAVQAGSGDNPQTKVLFDGDLLSLGTSFVYMGDFSHPDANAMYDGRSRPFSIGCRTNGALVWDRVARLHGVSGEWNRYELALSKYKPHETSLVWQPEPESFPLGEALPLDRHGGPATFDSDYAGAVDFALLEVFRAVTANAHAPGDQVLFLCGGPAANKEIQRRVAALWNRPVQVAGSFGAALGAAVGGGLRHRPDLPGAVMGGGTLVQPDPSLVASWQKRLSRLS